MAHGDRPIDEAAPGAFRPVRHRHLLGQRDELREMSSELGLNLSLEEMHRVRRYFDKMTFPHRCGGAVHRPSVERALLLQELQGLPEGACLQHHARRGAVQGGRRRNGLRPRVWLTHCASSRTIIRRRSSLTVAPPLVSAASSATCCAWGRSRSPSSIRLFFGPLDHQGELPPGVKSPEYLIGGVVAGIRDYGNRIGIPTIAGGSGLRRLLRRQLPRERRLHRHREE